MVLTDKQIEELSELSKPLMDWLDRNFHPHTSVIISACDAEIVEGVARLYRRNTKRQIMA